MMFWKSKQKVAEKQNELEIIRSNIDGYKASVQQKKDQLEALDSIKVLYFKRESIFASKEVKGVFMKIFDLIEPESVRRHESLYDAADSCITRVRNDLEWQEEKLVKLEEEKLNKLKELGSK